jgi:hypothetical protein
MGMAEEATLRAADVRASDRERERVVSSLREHAGEGRLDMDELAGRLDRAYAARTRAELAALTADLPEFSSRPPVVEHDPRRRELRSHITPFVAVNVLLVAVWALTGAGYFWPVWPILGWGIGVASHASETAFGGRFAFGGHCGRRRARHCARIGAGHRASA